MFFHLFNNDTGPKDDWEIYDYRYKVDGDAWPQVPFRITPTALSPKELRDEVMPDEYYNPQNVTMVPSSQIFERNLVSDTLNRNATTVFNRSHALSLQ